MAHKATRAFGLAFLALAASCSHGDTTVAVDVPMLIKHSRLRDTLSVKLLVYRNGEVVKSVESPLVDASERALRATFIVSGLPTHLPLDVAIEVHGALEPDTVLARALRSYTLASADETIVIDQRHALCADASEGSPWTPCDTSPSDSRLHAYLHGSYCVDASDCVAADGAPPPTCTPLGTCVSSCTLDHHIPFSDPYVPPEECDLGQLGGLTCESLGYPSGGLRCTAGCAIDTEYCGGACAGETMRCRTDADCCGTMRCDQWCRSDGPEWRVVTQLDPPSGWVALAAAPYFPSSDWWDVGRSVGYHLYVAGAAGLAQNFQVMDKMFHGWWSEPDWTSVPLVLATRTSLTVLGPGPDRASAVVVSPAGESAFGYLDRSLATWFDYGQLVDPVHVTAVTSPLTFADDSGQLTLCAVPAANVFNPAMPTACPITTVRAGVALRAVTWTDPTGVLGDGSTYWAVGDEGTVAQVTRAGEVKLVRSSGPALRAVATAGEVVWAVGDGGTVLSCTTAGCTDLTATFGVTTRLNSVATSKGLVFVVGDGGTSLSYRSSDGNVIDGSDATLGDLISVSAVDDGDADPFTMLFALSGQGVVLHRTVGVWP